MGPPVGVVMDEKEEWKRNEKGREGSIRKEQEDGASNINFDFYLCNVYITDVMVYVRVFVWRE